MISLLYHSSVRRTYLGIERLYLALSLREPYEWLNSLHWWKPGIPNWPGSSRAYSTKQMKILSMWHLADEKNCATQMQLSFLRRCWTPDSWEAKKDEGLYMLLHLPRSGHWAGGLRQLQERLKTSTQRTLERRHLPNREEKVFHSRKNDFICYKGKIYLFFKKERERKLICTRPRMNKVTEGPVKNQSRKEGKNGISFSLPKTQDW